MPNDHTPAKQPNVVVFFTDQQRWDASSLHGNPLELMPNFDRIARRHTHVANSFTCQPVCGPARASLQTGQYANTTGVWRNGLTLRQDADTLAKRFNDAGYRTGYIGKWHLSGEPQETQDPTRFGPVSPSRRGGYQDWLAAETLEKTSEAYQTRVWDENEQPVDLPGYRVDALTDAAVRYVDQRSKEDNPFFLFLSFLEPHHQNHSDDYPPPDGYRQRYTGQWTPPDLAALPTHEKAPVSAHTTIGGTTAQHLGGYWGMVKRLDEAFGRLMDSLKSLGIEDNTIVLFTSDHACHFRTRNSEYKRSCHETSIRVPTLLAGPGFEGGGELPQLVSLVDLPPTLLDAAGIDVPDSMQGRSLMPVLRRDPDAWRDWPDDVFVQTLDAECGRAVRTKRWKYAVMAPAAEDKQQTPDSDVYYETHLYDLENDPYELRNLVHADTHKEVRQDMRDRLLRYIKDVEGAEPRIETMTPQRDFARPM